MSLQHISFCIAYHLILATAIAIPMYWQIGAVWIVSAVVFAAVIFPFLYGRAAETYYSAFKRNHEDAQTKQPSRDNANGSYLIHMSPDTPGFFLFWGNSIFYLLQECINDHLFCCLLRKSSGPQVMNHLPIYLPNSCFHVLPSHCPLRFQGLEQLWPWLSRP